MNSLESMAERAQRQLDGMRTNHDAMARDVLALVALVRKLQAQDDEPAPSTPRRAAENFGDLFGEIFGGRRK